MQSNVPAAVEFFKLLAVGAGSLLAIPVLVALIKLIRFFSRLETSVEHLTAAAAEFSNGVNSKFAAHERWLDEHDTDIETLKIDVALLKGMRSPPPVSALTKPHR